MMVENTKRLLMDLLSRAHIEDPELALILTSIF